MNSSISKTKTNFIEWLSCERSAFYSFNAYPGKDLPYPDQAQKNQAYKVEEESTKLFPGIKKSHDFDFEINQSAPITVYQPTIKVEGNLEVRGDIIKKDIDSKIHIFEVKSSTKPKKEYIPDIAFQVFLLKKNNINIETCNLILLNGEFVRKGNINPKKLFQILDVSDQVKDYLKEDSEINRYIKEIESKTILERNISSTKCKKCPYIVSCLAGISSQILSIPRGGKKIQKLVDRGINNLIDIPEDIKLTENQQKYADVQISNKYQINKSVIKEVLSSLEFPITFLDYETIYPAIPKYDGTYPYQQVPFQFSIHILKDDGNLIYDEYLHLEKSNPMPNLLKHLSTVVGYEGSVISWNDIFEKSINNTMSGMYPDYKILLDSINERMFDLSIIFKNDYLHPKFMGSYSLKNVMPVFYDKLQYSDLSISEGGTASYKWMDMIFGNLDIKENEKIKRDLLEYSKLDTEGMVEIYKSLINLVN